jgi:alkanesulfonate monooxygenase SsuD/methylene tetrahydromethanopterin reductase-like flavin-dependent oxidoreductase (luciferase family)
MTDEYLHIIKAVWTHDVPSFRGRYFTFAGATFAPRPVQQPHPPIWVGGTPGTVSAPAVRRVAELCDAWHPLGLSLEDIARGIDMIRTRAAQVGRQDAVHFAPRNLLNLTSRARGSERAAFEGSPEEIATDIQRAQTLGCAYLTFDLPRETGVPGMMQAMQRFVRDVKPRVN